MTDAAEDRGRAREGRDAESQATLDVILRMEEALAANSDDMAAHFHEGFLWRGNAGCGVKEGLQAFRSAWQLPFRAAFTERDYRTERFLADGAWAACFGHIEATHSGPFMGVAPTGRRVTIPYMDFWRVEDGRIRDNPVFVDFAAVLRQLGRDPFEGHGWEAMGAPGDGQAQGDGQAPSGADAPAGRQGG